MWPLGIAVRRVPGVGRRDVFRCDQQKSVFSRLVDQYLRLRDSEHVVEERALREVNAHRPLLRTADASPVPHVPFSDRDVHVPKALGGRSNGFRKRTAGAAIPVAGVLTVVRSHHRGGRAQQCENGHDRDDVSCVHG